MYKSVEFTREKLYELVWEKPILALAKEIGVSDVAIGKACRRADIPLPGRGYWAKPVSHRRRAPLPTRAGEDNLKITFQVFEPGEFSKPPTAAPETISAIVVPETLQRPTELVRDARDRVKEVHEHHGRLLFAKRLLLNLFVSKSSLNRAMRIADTLIKSSLERGMRWGISGDGKTQIECNGQTIEVRVIEKISKRTIPLKERKWPSYDSEFVSTGKLVFETLEYVEGPTQKQWGDTSQKKLEDRIGEVLVGLPKIARALDERDAERAERDRQYRLEEKRERLTWERRESARLRREVLLGLVERWDLACKMERFCADAKRGLLTPNAAAWVDWAAEQAALLNPLTVGLDRFHPWSAKLPEYGASPWGRKEEPSRWDIPAEEE